MNYEAVIWDCDGVLIDSEVLACSAAADMLNDLGCNISLDEYVSNFSGKSFFQAATELEDKTGINLVKKICYKTLEKRQLEAFDKSLKAVDGIDIILENIKLPQAVASGSSYKRLHHSLGITNLLKYFNKHIYSAEMVEKGKPAPDVFLYAANKLNVNPKNCLVIEDGIHGINGARAAGMDVYTYIGGSHITDSLKEKLINSNVSEVVTSMHELLPLLNIPLSKAS